MLTNYVFLVDTERQPLNPIHPARARELLKKGRANVLRTYPYTLILKTEIVNPVLKDIELKIDPGSKCTGLALVQDGNVIWMANLEHRGSAIRDAMLTRHSVRRSRRNRKTRYRKARFLNRRRSSKWLPPSLMHRVMTIETWVRRLIKISPITSIAMELVKFDTQKMQNPEISGTEYQQGTLWGYEVREYLLEKWGRQCVYCSKENIPLEVEHIHPKSQGGSDRVSNLTLACRCCNQKKSDQPLSEFVKNKPELVKKIESKAKTPLKDASAVNSTRWKLFETLKATGLLLSTGTGSQTKYNRIQNCLEKNHCIDAACVGDTGLDVVLKTEQPLQISATGWGSRQMTRVNKYGFPCAKAKKTGYEGWRTGDLAKANIPKGKHKGIYPLCRIVAKSGSFLISVKGKKDRIGVSHKYLTVIQRRDGYNYSFCNGKK
jgi:5-methylcytosine-specific restriction endonuclease McrA